MENDVGYWKKRWEEGRTAFHEDAVGSALLRHGHLLGEGGRILVPLSGKSRDMTWLAREKGHSVVGIEVAEQAIRAYFEERSMTAMRSTDHGIHAWHGGGVTIFATDFFAASPELVGPVTGAYDRAALIALPPDTQEKYVEHLFSLVGKAPILLVGFAYDASAMSGPPYSVGEKDVARLFGATCDVQKLEEREVIDELPRFRERGLRSIVEGAFLVTRRSV